MPGIQFHRKTRGPTTSAIALTIIVLAVVCLPSTALAANLVYIDVVHADDPLQPVDTVYIGGEHCFRIWIENDTQLGGISTPYLITATGDVTWSWVEAGGFEVDGGEVRFLTGISGSRWMDSAAADGSCWDLGGTLVFEDEYYDNTQFGVTGAALNAGLVQGSLQPMLEAHFRPYGVWSDGLIGTICIDSLKYPGVDFVFIPSGTPAFSCQGCWPVKRVCGDPNGDGRINIADAVFMINYIFRGGPAPDPWQLGDANLDGVLNIADAVYLVQAVFGNGPMPGCPEVPPTEGR
jgi:hypothetical protein